MLRSLFGINRQQNQFLTMARRRGGRGKRSKAASDPNQAPAAPPPPPINAGVFMDAARGPAQVPPIPMVIKQQMMSFMSKFDDCIANLMDYRIDQARKRYEHLDIGGAEGKHATILEGLEPDDDTSSESASSGYSSQSSEAVEAGRQRTGPIDFFTNQVYNPPNPKRKSMAFSDLDRVFYQKDKKYASDRNFFDIIQAQERLPIRSLKQRVIEALQNNRAIVVAGDTGSGKSTQVPQFILEQFISQETNSDHYCNIAVTQPRRISAISLSERVAVELGEPSTGYTVGHNVRFDSKLPRRDLNVISFFTTGMLLKKMQRNPDLKGISHLIIDEVHERDCTTDFLLILVKRLLARRKDLKVVFMSASMDASLFSRYFNNCPIVSVSGRCYPVRDYYLEDICDEMRIRIPREDSIERAPKLNFNVLADLIRYIDDTREQGAVLCFMPGWKEMKSLQKELDSCRSRNKLKVLLAHSKLPINEQRLIFGKAPGSERKVILATNIAETSITINDVRYVIDTGLCNSIDYDPMLNMSTFGTRWISRANTKQRSGRAGRTSTGECFKLYSRSEERSFQEYPFPELLRIPLESVIMEAKCHCPSEKAVSFLSQAIQHPSVSAIHKALDELMLIGVLDSQENLTVLGKRVSDFSTHPRLSVSLVVASALRCLYPIINSSAVLSSTQEPFLSALTDKSRIREVKARLCMEATGGGRDPLYYMSDHVSYGNLMAQYDNAVMSKYELEFFIEENNLNRNAMSNIQECRNLYAKMLVGSKFVTSFDWYSYDSLPNRNMNELEFVIGTLVYSFYPKIVRVVKGAVKNGKLYPNKSVPTEVQSNSRVRFASDSIVKNISLGKQLGSQLLGDSEEDLSSMPQNFDNTGGQPGDEAEKRPQFLTYLNSRVDQESGLVVIKDGSVVPPITLLLFGGRSITVHDPNSNKDNYNNSVSSYNNLGGNYSNGNPEENLVTISMDRYNLLSFKVNRDDAKVILDWRDVWFKYFNWYVHTKDTSKSVDENDAIISGTFNEYLNLSKKLYAAIK